jgi:hypothetical protein
MSDVGLNAQALEVNLEIYIVVCHYNERQLRIIFRAHSRGGGGGGGIGRGYFFLLTPSARG